MENGLELHIFLESAFHIDNNLELHISYENIENGLQLHISEKKCNSYRQKFGVAHLFTKVHSYKKNRVRVAHIRKMQLVKLKTG